MRDDEAMRPLPVLVAVAAAGALAAPAYADPEGKDAEFVAALNKAGITYRSADQAVAAGKQVCALMDDGQSGADVVKKVTEVNPGFGVTGATQFAAIAATAYCPQYVTEGSGE